MKVIVHIEISDAHRKIMARQLGVKGLATRAQVHAITTSLLSSWLLQHASQQYQDDAKHWRRGQPEVER